MQKPNTKTSSTNSTDEKHPSSNKPADESVTKKTQFQGIKPKTRTSSTSSTGSPTLAGVIAAKAVAKTMKPGAARTKSLSTSGNPMSAIAMSAKRKPIKPKMDLAKALSMMGFGTARSLDPSGNKNARAELNVCLSRKMADFDTKRKKLLELDKIKTNLSEAAKNQAKDKLRDDIRTLHEAYQFLARKYIRDEEKMKEKMNGTLVGEDNDVIDLDAIDDLHLVNNLYDDDDNEEDNDVFNDKIAGSNENKVNNEHFRIKVERKKSVKPTTPHKPASE